MMEIIGSQEFQFVMLSHIAKVLGNKIRRDGFFKDCHGIQIRHTIYQTF